MMQYNKKETKKSDEKMSILGIGKHFVFFSILYGFIAFVLKYYFNPSFQIKLFPISFLYILGSILIAVGVAFYITSVFFLTKAFRSNKLVTTGPYSICRHPLYTSWVIFIVPGVCLLMKSWILLTIPIFMYIILSNLIKKEEIYLENVFGAEYNDYQKNIPLILPYGFLKSNKIKKN